MSIWKGNGATRGRLTTTNVTAAMLLLTFSATGIAQDEDIGSIMSGLVGAPVVVPERSGLDKSGTVMLAAYGTRGEMIDCGTLAIEVAGIHDLNGLANLPPLQIPEGARVTGIEFSTTFGDGYGGVNRLREYWNVDYTAPDNVSETPSRAYIYVEIPREPGKPPAFHTTWSDGLDGAGDFYRVMGDRSEALRALDR